MATEGVRFSFSNEYKNEDDLKRFREQIKAARAELLALQRVSRRQVKLNLGRGTTGGVSASNSSATLASKAQLEDNKKIAKGLSEQVAAKEKLNRVFGAGLSLESRSVKQSKSKLAATRTELSVEQSKLNVKKAQAALDAIPVEDSGSLRAQQKRLDKASNELKQLELRAKQQKALSAEQKAFNAAAEREGIKLNRIQEESIKQLEAKQAAQTKLNNTQKAQQEFQAREASGQLTGFNEAERLKVEERILKTQEARARLESSNDEVSRLEAGNQLRKAQVSLDDAIYKGRQRINREQRSEGSKLNREQLERIKLSEVEAESQRELANIRKTSEEFSRRESAGDFRNFEAEERLKVEKAIGKVVEDRSKLEGNLNTLERQKTINSLKANEASLSKTIETAQKRVNAARERSLELEDRNLAVRRAQADFAAKNASGEFEGFTDKEKNNTFERFVKLQKASIDLENSRGDKSKQLLAEVELEKRRVDALNTVQRAQKRVALSTTRLRKASQQWIGTLRGVVSGLLVYQGVTRGTQAALAAFASGVTFGNSLETQRAAIAGLISGQSSLFDQTGKLVDQQNRFSAASSIAADQLDKIRQQALGTSATFGQLVKNFQLNVAPALSAGLDLDEFRKVALRFSQAATALGVPQEQLAEEIRSTLSGSITKRNTRIPTALNITNEDIANAKEQGELSEFLLESFEGVSQAAEALRNSLPVVFSDIQDAFQIAAEKGARPFRAELVEVGKELRRAFTTEGGDITSGFQSLFNAAYAPLKAALSDLRPLVPTVVQGVGTLFEALAQLVSTLSFVANAFQPVLNLIVGFGQGVLGVVGVVSDFLRSVRNLATESKVVSTALNALNLAAQTVGVTLGTVFAFRAAKLGLTSFLALMAKLLPTLAKAVKASRAFAAAQALAAGPFLGITAAIGLAIFAIDRLIAKLEPLKQAFLDANDAIDSILNPGAAKAEQETYLASLDNAIKLTEYRIKTLQDEGSAVGALVVELNKLKEARANPSSVPTAARTKASDFLEDGFLDNFIDKIGGAAESASETFGDKFSSFGNPASELFTSDQVEKDLFSSPAIQQAREARAEFAKQEGTISQLLDTQLQLFEQQDEATEALNKKIQEQQGILLNPKLDLDKKAAAEKLLNEVLDERDAIYQAFARAQSEQFDLLSRQVLAARGLKQELADIDLAEQLSLNNTDQDSPFASMVEDVVRSTAELERARLEARRLEGVVEETEAAWIKVLKTQQGIFAFGESTGDLRSKELSDLEQSLLLEKAKVQAAETLLEVKRRTLSDALKLQQIENQGIGVNANEQERLNLVDPQDPFSGEASAIISASADIERAKLDVQATEAAIQALADRWRVAGESRASYLSKQDQAGALAVSEQDELRENLRLQEAQLTASEQRLSAQKRLLAQAQAEKALELSIGAIDANEQQALADINADSPFASLAADIVQTRAELQRSATVAADLRNQLNSQIPLDRIARTELAQSLALEEARIKVLRERDRILQASNSRKAGIDGFVRDQTENFSSANNAERELSGYLSAFRSGLSTSIQAVLTGGDLNQGFAQLGLDLATTFINRILEDALLKPFFDSLGAKTALAGVGEGTADAAEGATQAALDRTRMEIAQGTLESAALAFSSSLADAGFSSRFAQTSIAKMGIAAALAAKALESVAASQVGGALAGGVTGAAGTPNALGGPAYLGRAEGGHVPRSSPQLPKAPSGYDRRDKIPALLRANEYVATPEMNNRTGGALYPILERLRRGVHSIPDMRRLSASAASRLGIRGLATGGSVSSVTGPPSSSRSNQAGPSGGGGGMFPVMVVNERNADKIMGHPSLSKQMARQKGSVSRSLRSRGIQ